MAEETEKSGVINLTGKPLEGEALEQFKKAFNASALLRSTYNEDGTMKPDTQKFVE